MTQINQDSHAPCLIISCSPDLHSFTTAIGQEVLSFVSKHTNGSVHYIDLYREAFDPILNMNELNQKWSFDSKTQQHIQQLQKSELVIIVHPVWWAGMPALLSGWVQRIWKPEVAFRYEGAEFAKKSAVGLFGQKRFLIVYLSDEEAKNDSCQILERQWDYILNFCNAQEIHFEPIGNMRNMRLGERREKIQYILKRVQTILQEE